MRLILTVLMVLGFGAAPPLAAAQMEAVRSPVFVPGITGAVQAAVGADFYLVLLTDGRVLSWGNNREGQLGQGTVATGPASEAKPERVPAFVVDLSDVVWIAAGNWHALAVRRDGTVWAWGRNVSNELGLGKPDPARSARPIRVPGVDKAIAVEANVGSSYALLRDGTVLQWGEHLWRIPRSTNSSVPVPVPDVSTAIAIRAGTPCLALLREGSVVSWGGGYLGDGTRRNSGVVGELPPVKVAGMTDAVAIAATPFNSAVVRRDGSVWVWGSGDSARLGLGKRPMTDTSSGDLPLPVRVPGLDRVIDVAWGWAGSVVLSDGTVRAWGDERLGATGRPGVDFLPVPTAIPGLNDVVRAWARHYGNLALTRDGRIRAWGSIPLPR